MTAEPREVAAPDPLLLTAYLEAPYADVAAVPPERHCKRTARQRTPPTGTGHAEPPR